MFFKEGSRLRSRDIVMPLLQPSNQFADLAFAQILTARIAVISPLAGYGTF